MNSKDEGKVAETVPMLSQWECRNRVTPVTQKSCCAWWHSFDV